MNIDFKNLKKLTKLMKKEGVLSLKTPEIELSLDPKQMFPVEQKLTKKQAKENAKTQTQYEKPPYTEMDILGWSSPGYTITEIDKEAEVN